MHRSTCVSMVSALTLGIAWAATPASALTVNLEPVAEGLTHPTAMVQPEGDDRMFVTEQIGLVRVLTADGELLDEPFLDIRHKVVDLHPEFDERGLLGLTFHPEFADNGRFYIAYSTPIQWEGDLEKKLWWSHTNVVEEYTVSTDDPNVADPSSVRVISAIDWPQFNHNGHWIDFGPDGYLYISVGDGGYANDWGIGHNVTEGNAQDLSVIHSNMVRVDVDGSSDGKSYGIPWSPRTCRHGRSISRRPMASATCRPVRTCSPTRSAWRSPPT